MIRPDQLLSVHRDDRGDIAGTVQQVETEIVAHGLPEEYREDAAEIIRADTTDLGDGDPSVLECETIATKYGSSLGTGHTAEDAADRLAVDGPNELEQEPRLGFWMLFLLQLTSFIILLLIAAAVASALVNATSSVERATDPLNYTTPIAIFILVLLNAGIAASVEAQAGDALDKLKEKTAAECKVIRDGKEQTIKSADLVVGDVVLFQSGDVVPADLRLFEAADVKVDEKALTGEPDDVAKNAKVKPRAGGGEQKLLPPNMVFSGCPVVTGTAKGIVWSTGMNTEIGKIAKLMANKDKNAGKKCGCIPAGSSDQTPLQENVEKLGARIGVGAIVICIVVFIIGGLLGTEDPQDRDTNTWLYMILVAVTLAVAAIPEGIPLCVTISLSLGAKAMADGEPGEGKDEDGKPVRKHQVNVTKLPAVETLGSASVICSDKTGTLTEGKMTMTQMWTCNSRFDISGQGFDPTTGEVTKAGVNANSDMGVRSTLFCALLCSDTQLWFGKDEDGKGKDEWRYKGNSSEAPIVVAAQKIGFKRDDASRSHPRTLTIPFNSSRKMMLTVSDVTGKSHVCDGGMPLPAGASMLSVVKGGSDKIPPICNKILTQNGQVVPFGDADRKVVQGQIDEFSDQALRVLAVAINVNRVDVDLQNEDISMDTKFEACKKDLILLGLVASIDPDRAGVKESVITARGAGIRVIMITGDYLKTAIAIGKRVSIIQDEDNVDECACDCNKLRPDGEDKYIEKHEMDELTMKTRVFARAKPADKLEIVKSLQRQGLVSAMTGDGVNDAPALNEAMIGVAMGIAGTEVAKGAAEMVLMDDNFASIVKAVERGRAIYSGIQKFVAFIMSVHIAEVIQIFVCVVAQMPLMRTPLQILFLILVTDLPPSIALGMEPGERDILKSPPRPKSEPIVLWWMWVGIMANGLILSVVILGVYVFCLEKYVGTTQFKEFTQRPEGFTDDFCTDGSADFDLFLNTTNPSLTNLLDSREDANKYCLEQYGLIQARTVAFISLVFSENIRAYISRSFDKPVWVNFFGNQYMQIAVVLAIIFMLMAVLIPVLSDKILLLDGLSIGGEGWAIALVGPVATVILCELFKIPTATMKRNYERQVREGAGDESDDSDDYTTSGSDDL